MDPYRYYNSQSLDLEVMAIKRYSTFHNAPGLQSHYQMV